MFLDHEKPDSISHNSHLVNDQLRRLRGMLIRGAANLKNPSSVAITPPMMDVRLHTNELGEMWWNTGDPKYDTQLGIGSVSVKLTALDTDATLSALAESMVQGIAKLLADQGVS